MSKSTGSGKRPLGSNSGFVNRRGHNADLESVDLSDVSIDNQSEEVFEVAAKDTNVKEKSAKDKSAKGKAVANTATQDTKPTVSLSETETNNKKLAVATGVTRAWSRKKTWLIAGIVLALITLPLALGELLRAHYLASAQNAKDNLETIVKQDVMPMQKQTELTSGNISSLTSKLEGARDKMCAGGLLDNMATLYPRAREAHGACIAQRGQIASLVTQLRDTEKMLAYIESLDAALAPVSTPSTDAFAVIATQQANWQKVNESLGKLSPPASLKAGHEALTVSVKTVVDGWSDLNVAHNEQNAANFQAAEKQLGDGYAAVRASKASFADSIAAKQRSISVISLKF